MHSVAALTQRGRRPEDQLLSADRCTGQRQVVHRRYWKFNFKYCGYLEMDRCPLMTYAKPTRKAYEIQKHMSPKPCSNLSIKSAPHIVMKKVSPRPGSNRRLQPWKRVAPNQSTSADPTGTASKEHNGARPWCVYMQLIVWTVLPPVVQYGSTAKLSPQRQPTDRWMSSSDIRSRL